MKTVAMSLIAAGVIAAPAYAEVNINSNTQFSRQLSSDKWADIANRQGVDEARWAVFKDLWLNRNTYTDDDKDRIIRSLDILNSGDTFTLYKNPASAVGATVASAPVEYVGAGSNVATKQVGGQTVLDVENVTSGTFGKVTKNFAGGTTSGAIAVGSKDAFRTIQHVAAGRVTETSTDAVNGSQLWAAQQGINQNAQDIAANKQTIDKGWNAVVGGTKANIKMGDDLTFKAGSNNAKVTLAGKAVTFDVARNLNVDTVTTGNVVLGGTGLNNGGNKITNVDNGVAPTDAVNVRQLNEVKTSGLTFAGNTGTPTKKALGSTVTIAGEGSVTTVANPNGVSVKLTDNVNVVNNLTAGGKVTAKGGLDVNNKTINNVADGVAPTDAVNVRQLTNLKNVVDKGFNIADTANGNDNVKLGETVTYKTDNNLKAVVTNNAVTHSLARDINIAGTLTVNGKTTLKGGLDVNNQKITGVAKGEVSATSTEAVNGAQLDELAKRINNINAGGGQPTNWTIKGDTGTDTVSSGDTLTYAGGTNTVTKVTDNKMTVDLKPVITVDEVKVGNSSFSKTGLDNGGNKVTNVADGSITATSKDAVNGSQLYATNNKVTGIETKVNKGFDVQGNTGTKANVQLGTTLNIKGTDGNIVSTTGADGVGLKLADTINVKTGANIAGITINNTGINGNGKGITNVKEAKISADSTDVVIGKQLHELKESLKNQPTAPTVTTTWTINGDTGTDTMRTGEALTYAGDGKNTNVAVSDNKVVVGLNKDLNVDSVTVGTSSFSKSGLDNGGNKVTNIADGSITATSKDAINGSQLYATNNKVTNIETKVNKGFDVQGNDGTKTNVQLGTTLNIKGTDSNIVSTTGVDGVGLKLADTINVKTGANIGGITINKGGSNFNNTVIDGVKDGEIAAGSKQAVNGGQIFNLLKNTNDKVDAGWTVTTDNGKHNVKLGTELGVVGGKNTATKVENGKLVVDLKDNLNIAGNITLNGGGITGIKAGDVSVNSTDAVNGAQLYAVANSGYTFSDGKNSQNFKLNSTVNFTGDKNVVTKVTDKGVQVGLADNLNIKGNVTLNGGGITGIKAGDVSVNSTDAVNGGQLYQTNQNVTELKNKVNQGWNLKDEKGNTANVQMGGSVTMKNTDKNVDITVAKDGSSTINLSRNLNVQSVKMGDVHISDGGLHNGYKVISGVADGTENHHAVNVGQLNHAVNKLNDRIGKVDKNARAGSASAIAAASLGQAWEAGSNSISAAVGHYDGQNALAIGGSHITDNNKIAVKYNASVNQQKKFGAGASITLMY